MRYKIEWIYSTLKSNYSSLSDMLKSFDDTGIQVTVDKEEEGGWYDLIMTHEFIAKNDKKAIEYTNDYEFGGTDGSIFNLIKYDKTIYTEDDFTNELVGVK